MIAIGSLRGLAGDHHRALRGCRALGLIGKNALSKARPEARARHRRGRRPSPPPKALTFRRTRRVQNPRPLEQTLHPSTSMPVVGCEICSRRPGLLTALHPCLVGCEICSLPNRPAPPPRIPWSRSGGGGGVRDGAQPFTQAPVATPRVSDGHRHAARHLGECQRIKARVRVVQRTREDDTDDPPCFVEDRPSGVSRLDRGTQGVDITRHFLTAGDVETTATRRSRTRGRLHGIRGPRGSPRRRPSPLARRPQGERGGPERPGTLCSDREVGAGSK